MDKVGDDRNDQNSSSNAALDASQETSLDNEGHQVGSPSLEEGVSETTVSNQDSEIDWKLLPPLLGPEEAKKKEFQCGSFILGGAAAMCFVAVQSAFGSLDEQTSTVASIFVVAVSGLFFIEMLCLLAMYHKNPGEVKRTPSTCYPIPPQVQPYVRSYIHGKQQQQNQSNAENTTAVDQETVPAPSELYISMHDENNNDNEEESVDTYCVRCLVWRRGKKKYFHCNTCQRCVSHYDHHCNVFGRCIAGRLPFQGNLPIFYITIVASGLLYAFTAIGLAWKVGVGGLI